MSLRALAPRLSSSAHYVVTDLNQPMLEHATRLQADDGRITWQQANALELPFSNAEFDVICCQFGVMFFPDRVAETWWEVRLQCLGSHQRERVSPMTSRMR